MKASFHPYQLQFKKPSGTSRGILTHKKIWLIKLWKEENPSVFGIGECNPLVGLSIDDRDDFEEHLQKITNNINDYIDSSLQISHSKFLQFPSIRFAIETALQDLKNGGRKILFENDFSMKEKGIVINGLIWMSSPQEMVKQIEEKIKNGFHCLKLKIGALDFNSELKIIKEIRTSFSADDLEIRVDANGAFSAEEALFKLDELSKFYVHSIEQPIQQGQVKKMAELCKKTPLAIALDEELISHQNLSDKQNLLDEILPQYIILKPSLLGGWKASEEWIDIARKNKIGWWVTSALESNIGLNAIAQWTANFDLKIPQGLGTGQLYTNNFHSPLHIEGKKLYYKKTEGWSISI